MDRSQTGGKRISMKEIRKTFDERILGSSKWPFCLLLLPPLAAFTVSLYEFYFYRLIGETTAFFVTSGVEHVQHNQDLFRFLRSVFYSHLQYEGANILVKATTLRINFNVDGAPMASHTHTHPSHSQTSRLFSTSLSLGIPFPLSTQCVRGVL